MSWPVRSEIQESDFPALLAQVQNVALDSRGETDLKREAVK